MQDANVVAWIGEQGKTAKFNVRVSADAVAIGGDHLIAPSFVTARLHQPIDDHQPVAHFAKAGGLVEKRSFLDAGHPLFGVVFGNDGFELVRLDLDGSVVLGHTRPLGFFRRLRQQRCGNDSRDEQT